MVRRAAVSATTAAVHYSTQRRPTNEKTQGGTKANAPADGRPGCAGSDPTVACRELFLCQTKYAQEEQVAGHPFHTRETRQGESQTPSGWEKRLSHVRRKRNVGEKKMYGGEVVAEAGEHEQGYPVEAQNGREGPREVGQEEETHRDGQGKHTGPLVGKHPGGHVQHHTLPYSELESR